MWGADGMIYFSSERDGIFNIWKISPTGGEPTQVTSHKQDGVQFPSMSPDGKTIAYENEFELWTLAVPGGSPKKVAIDLDVRPEGEPRSVREVQRARRRLLARRPTATTPPSTSTARSSSSRPTPRSARSRQVDLVLVARPARAVLAERPLRRLHVRRIEGRGDLAVRPRRPGARKKLTTHASFKTGGAWSPDSKQLAYVAANRLFIADVEAAKSIEVAYNIAGGYQGVSFSPDGKWLVYSRARRRPERRRLPVRPRRRRRSTTSRRTRSATRARSFTPDGKRARVPLRPRRRRHAPLRRHARPRAGGSRRPAREGAAEEGARPRRRRRRTPAAAAR